MLVAKGKMIHLDLTRPVQLLWFGEFISPERGWKHLTRRLFEYELFAVTEGVLYIADATTANTRCARGSTLSCPPPAASTARGCAAARFYWMHFRCPALPASISMPVQGGFADAGTVHALAEKLLRGGGTGAARRAVAVPGDRAFARTVRAGARGGRGRAARLGAGAAVRADPRIRVLSPLFGSAREGHRERARLPRKVPFRRVRRQRGAFRSSATLRSSGLPRRSGCCWKRITP